MSDGGRPRFGAEDLLLLAAVTLLPWAIAGVQLSSYRLAAFLVTAAAAIAVSRIGPRVLGDPGDRRWLLPAFLLAAWGALQIVPLPPAVLASVSPATARILGDLPGGWPGPSGRALVTAIESDALRRVPEAGLLPRADTALVPDPAPRGRSWEPASLFPDGTRERLLWYVALLAAFVVTSERARPRERSSTYAVALQSVMVALAGIALLQLAAWNGKLLWVVPVSSKGRAMGPYVNPTHFAALMEIAIPWLLAGTIHHARGPSKRRLDPRVVLLGAGTLLCVAAAFVAASRMATAFIIATSLVVAAVGIRRAGLRAGWVGGILLAVIVLSAILAARGELGERVRSSAVGRWGDIGSDRVFATSTSWKIALDFPVTGIGVGAFRYVFPRYLVPGEAETWLQAHDDYAELLSGAGFVALALVGWLAWGFWRRVVGTLRRTGGSGDLPWLGLAAGLGALSLHEFLDFSLQTPANALIFATSAGLLAARARTSAGSDGRGSSRRPLWSVTALALASLYLVLAIDGLRRGTGYPRAARLAAVGDLARAERLLEGEGTGFDRFETLWLRGEVLQGRFDASRESGRLLERSAGDLLRAADLSPASAWPWGSLAGVYERLGRVGRAERPFDLSRLGRGAWGRVGRDEAIAIGLARTAVAMEPQVFPHHDRLVNLYLTLGLPSEAAAAARASAAVQPVFTHHATLDFDRLPRPVLEAFADGSTEAIGRTPLLSKERHLLALGQFERRLGRLDRAERALRAALAEPADDISRAEERFHLGLLLWDRGATDEALALLAEAGRHPVFAAVAASDRGRLLADAGRLQESLAALDEARRVDPRNVDLARRFAAVARRAGEIARAEESYRWAMLVDSNDPGLRADWIEFLFESGRRAEAESALDDLERSHPDAADLPRLRSLRAR